MPPAIYTQNVIALIWDFDKTLTHGCPARAHGSTNRKMLALRNKRLAGAIGATGQVDVLTGLEDQAAWLDSQADSND